MELAKMAATWSKDKSTGVGAVIVNDKKKVLSVGFNGFPRGVNDDIESRHVRPEKNHYVVHAERNALDEAETSLEGATIYCTFFTCATCAHGIIQKGLKKVVAPEPDWNAERYAETQRHALQMYKEAGVEVQFYNEPSDSLIVFWKIGCGGGEVLNVISEDKFDACLEFYKKKLESKGHKVKEYTINESLGAIQFHLDNDKYLLNYGKYEKNDFIFKRK